MRVRRRAKAVLRPLRRSGVYPTLAASSGEWINDVGCELVRGASSRPRELGIAPYVIETHLQTAKLARTSSVVRVDSMDWYPGENFASIRAMSYQAASLGARRIAVVVGWLSCAASASCSSAGEPTQSSGAQQPEPAGHAAAAGASGAPAQTMSGTAGTTTAPTMRTGAGEPAAGAGGAPAGVAGMGGVSGAAAAGTTAGAAAAEGGAGAPATGPTAGASGEPGGQAGAAGAEGAEVTDAIWIATTGSDANPGTEAMPLATLAAAVEAAAAGMTIWVNPGTYQVEATVVLKTVGTEEQPVKVFAVAGEQRPVFDFSAQPRGDSKSRGIEISGDHWHLKGFDVINAGDNCVHIAGGHNTLERIVVHDCSDTGIQISANSSEADDKSRAANNLILNCDSYANYDAQNQGENADGFAAKLYIGPGNVFRGCRAWNNADDGWDLFASDDVVVIEDCWAIANGKIGPGQNNTNGDGNGFKLGGAAKAGDPNMGGAQHEVNRCYSIENAACGFVRNNNTQAPRLMMCGGRGNGKGLLCSLSNSGAVAVTMNAAAAIAAERDKDGNLPAIH